MTAHLIGVLDVLHRPVCRGVPAQGSKEASHIVGDAKLEGLVELPRRLRQHAAFARDALLQVVLAGAVEGIVDAAEEQGASCGEEEIEEINP